MAPPLSLLLVPAVAAPLEPPFELPAAPPAGMLALPPFALSELPPDGLAVVPPPLPLPPVLGEPLLPEPQAESTSAIQIPEMGRRVCLMVHYLTAIT